MDVWDSERVLFIAYDGPVPHTLMAQIGEVGDTMVPGWPEHQPLEEAERERLLDAFVTACGR